VDAYQRLNEVFKELGTTSLKDESNNEELPNFYWHRFTRKLVLAGFGDYEKADAADIVEASVFLLLGDDKSERNRRWLNS